MAKDEEGSHMQFSILFPTSIFVVLKNSAQYRNIYNAVHIILCRFSDTEISLTSYKRRHGRDHKTMDRFSIIHGSPPSA